MTTLIDEHFEGGSNGAAITTGNTGFSTLTGTPTFDSSQFMHGALSMLVNPSAATEYGSANFVSSVGAMGVRFYARFTALPAANTILAQANLGVTTNAQIRFNTAGTVTIRNGTTAISTTTAVLSTGTWYRFEWILDSTGSTQELKVFLGDATTPLSGGDVSGTYTLGVMDRLLVGVPVAATLTYNVDDVIVTDTAVFPGPASGGSVVNAVATPARVVVGSVAYDDFGFAESATALPSLVETGVTVNTPDAIPGNATDGVAVLQLVVIGSRVFLPIVAGTTQQIPRKFVGPVRTEVWPLTDGVRLAVKVTINQTLYRRNGTWLVGENLNWTDLEGVDRLYQGGATPPLTDAQLDELVAAGLGQYVVDDPDPFPETFTETF